MVCKNHYKSPIYNKAVSEYDRLRKDCKSPFNEKPSKFDKTNRYDNCGNYIIIFFMRYYCDLDK